MVLWQHLLTGLVLLHSQHADARAEPVQQNFAAVQAAAGEGGAEEAEEGFGGMGLKSRSCPDLQPAVNERTKVLLPTCFQGTTASIRFKHVTVLLLLAGPS